VKTAAVLLITSNRGLCGAFNGNIIKEARALIKRLEGEGTAVELHAVGRKAIGYFKYLNRPMAAQRTDLGDKPSAADAASLVDDVMAQFASGRLDAVYVVYAKFNSVVSTPPTSEQVLPVAAPKAAAKVRDFILSPSPEQILSELLPLAVRNAIYRALIETAAGFQAAQRTAMKNATDNASDMLTTLRRTYNRARQAQITQEIAEIVGGAAALQG